MDQILSLLASKYQGCCQLLYDDLLLGLKSIRQMSPRTLKDGVRAVHKQTGAYLYLEFENYASRSLLG